MKAVTLGFALLAGALIGGGTIQAIHAQARPPVFLIFDAEIKDQAAYQPFVQTAVREIQSHGGRFLVLGATPEVVSGSPTPNRISISQWSSKDEVMRWFNSEAMKPVREAQAKYTTTRLVVVEGRAQ